VVPIHASYLLLGRPWWFDRKAKHDRCKNRYLLEKDGMTYTLAPLSPGQVFEDQLNLKKKSEVEMVIQKYEVMVTIQKYIQKRLVRHAYLNLLLATIFIQCYWRQKLVKREFWRLKKTQWKLKRERKTEVTKKPCEVVSLKTENKVSFKERTREERKDSNSVKGEKKLIEVESGENKIRMKKEESIENIGKHSKVLPFLTCLLFYLCLRRYILTLTILILLFLVLLYLFYRILKMI